MSVCTSISFDNKKQFSYFLKNNYFFSGNDCFSRNLCSTHAHLLTTAILAASASAAVLMMVVVVLGVGGIEACGWRIEWLIDQRSNPIKREINRRFFTSQPERDSSAANACYGRVLMGLSLESHYSVGEIVHVCVSESMHLFLWKFVWCGRLVVAGRRVRGRAAAAAAAVGRRSRRGRSDLLRWKREYWTSSVSLFCQKRAGKTIFKKDYKSDILC